MKPTVILYQQDRDQIKHTTEISNAHWTRGTMRNALATIDAWQELVEAQKELLACYRTRRQTRHAVVHVTAAKKKLGLR